jgi:sporulation protein YtfJ
MANENKLQDIIRTSLESIRSMIDAGTVIGDPITTEAGVTIVPVSKVSVGYASGGIDFNGKKDNAPQNFGAGGGTGLTIAPVGFLVIKKDGEVEMINVGMPAPQDPIEQITSLIERSPEIFGRIKAAFKKNKPEEEESMADVADEASDEAVVEETDAE